MNLGRTLRGAETGDNPSARFRESLIGRNKRGRHNRARRGLHLTDNTLATSATQARKPGVVLIVAVRSGAQVASREEDLP